ncbi:hypothetical protein MMC25_002993 [Agyrium rufum]|nr:hypothetical protein [Agyrium rufum]
MAKSLVVSLLGFAGLAAASNLVSTGSTLTVNDIPYYVPAAPLTTLSVRNGLLRSLPSAAGFVPLTVISTTSLTFSQASLESVISNFTASDDVFQSAFAEAVYLQYTGALPAGPKNPFKPHMKNANSTLIGTSTSQGTNGTNSTSVLPQGPYFITATGAVYQAWRLYSDFAGAFTQPLIPSGDKYAPLPAAIAGIESPAVAVPSRLYDKSSAAKPLAGVRLGVKDIYDVAGVKTSDGNRAIYSLYPPKTKNAVAVQLLVDAGAVIVGKMKTSQFANGEMATADWVDYHSPFNPRGDGYNDPSSSSSGPGAAMGSYPWLDLTIGSDTGGSIRGPSQVQGLFGNRPSHGLVSLEGVMPLAPELDTAGFLTRDPVIWATAGSVLYQGLEFYTEYPKSIQTLSFPQTSRSPADTMVLDFLAKLESFLGAKTTALNITSLWSSTKPANADPSLTDLLNITYPILISKEQVNLVRTPFYEAYGAVHDGRLPFVDPAPLVRWGFGDSYPESVLTDAINNKTIFMDWFSSNVLVNDSTTCSDSLLLYVGSEAQPNPRNQYLGPPGVPYGFSSGRISPFTEVPDVVVPLGQALSNSTITMHEEYLPVTVDFLAAKGCDGMLFNLINDLVDAGIVTVPMAGGTLTGGEVLM